MQPQNTAAFAFFFFLAFGAVFFFVLGLATSRFPLLSTHYPWALCLIAVHPLLSKDWIRLFTRFYVGIGAFALLLIVLCTVQRLDPAGAYLALSGLLTVLCSFFFCLYPEFYSGFSKRQINTVNSFKTALHHHLEEIGPSVRSLLDPIDFSADGFSITVFYNTPNPKTPRSLVGLVVFKRHPLYPIFNAPHTVVPQERAAFDAANALLNKSLRAFQAKHAKACFLLTYRPSEIVAHHSFSSESAHERMARHATILDAGCVGDTPHPKMDTAYV